MIAMLSEDDFMSNSGMNMTVLYYYCKHSCIIITRLVCCIFFNGRRNLWTQQMMHLLRVSDVQHLIIPRNMFSLCERCQYQRPPPSCVMRRTKGISLLFMDES